MLLEELCRGRLYFEHQLNLEVINTMLRIAELASCGDGILQFGLA